jgi:hypothetical protein
MNAQMKAALASYARSAAVAIVVAISMGKTDPKEILIAGAIAVAAPLSRALNPKDPAFGKFVADVVLTDKLAKPAKKAAPKK